MSETKERDAANKCACQFLSHLVLELEQVDLTLERLDAAQQIKG